MQASRRAGTLTLDRRQRSGNLMTGIKIGHPEVTVRLTGGDGNAFTVLGAVKNALADYDTLPQTCMRWVDVS